MQTPKSSPANDAGVTRLKEDFRQTSGEIRDDLEAVAGRAGRKVREYVDTAGDELTHAADSITSQIRSKPVQSSLLALAAGLVLGAFFRR